MEGKPVKIFPNFTLIFSVQTRKHCICEKNYSSFFLEKPKLIPQFPSSEVPDTSERQLQLSSIFMHVMDPPFCPFTPSHRASPPKPDTVRNLHSNLPLPKTYSSPK